MNLVVFAVSLCGNSGLAARGNCVQQQDQEQEAAAAAAASSTATAATSVTNLLMYIFDAWTPA